MSLLLWHPEVTGRSCDDCAKYVYDDTPTEMGPKVMRRGLPVLRPPGSPLPCYHCPKIPAGKPKHRDFAVELSERNWQVYIHYRQCVAVGAFPDDPIVRMHAGIIRSIEDRHSGRSADSLQMIVKILLSLLK